MFSFWSFPRWISWRWDFSVLWVQEKCFESFVILIIFQMDQLPFSRSEDFSALWVLEKSENVLSLLTSVRVLEKSVVILIISQIDRVKLRVREICHCCFKRVFNWWYLKRITHTPVHCCLPYACVQWCPQASRVLTHAGFALRTTWTVATTLSKLSLQLLQKKGFDNSLLLSEKNNLALCSSRLRIVKHSLCGRWAPQKGMEYISRRHVLVKYISKYLVKHISKYPSKFFIPSGLTNCERFCFVFNIQNQFCSVKSCLKYLYSWTRVGFIVV